ncbi:MAG TPA: SRPBCC family protein [Solirubrobacteraceae bacterium]|nr:SRPBCC family protein [Solirubrobacteraceae bacterium]
MDPISLSITVGRPREEVFDYLADIANHAEFTDHFLTDWHLTREDPVGRGAGARFRVKTPLQRFSWMGVSFIEVDAPWRIVEAGRGGKYNRIRSMTVYTLEPAADDATRVKLTVETEPVTISDRLMESLGARSWTRRQNRRALRRLRSILEEGKRRGARVTIAGG